VADPLIQPAPPGLLSALALKAQGRNPDKLSETVIPTIELSHWYNAANSQVESGYTTLTTDLLYATSNTLTTNGVTTWETPEDEMWWVRSYSVGIVVAGTVTDIQLTQLAPVLFARQSGAQAFAGRGRYVGDNGPNFGGAPDVGTLVVSPSLRDVWLPPGSRPGFALIGKVVSADDINLVGIMVADRFKI